MSGIVAHERVSLLAAGAFIWTWLAGWSSTPHLAAPPPVPCALLYGQAAGRPTGSTACRPALACAACYLAAVVAASLVAPLAYRRRRYGLDKAGMRVGVVGLGGLGHVAVKILKALGCEVTVVSTSDRKKQEALEVIWGGGQMERHSNLAAIESGGEWSREHHLLPSTALSASLVHPKLGTAA